MMIDFALVAQVERGLEPHAAVREADRALRPIMMTSMVAILAAMPLAIGVGEGVESAMSGIALRFAVPDRFLAPQCCNVTFCLNATAIRRAKQAAWSSLMTATGCGWEMQRMRRCADRHVDAVMKMQ